MGDYDAQLDNETYDLSSLAWLAHPWQNQTWRERAWYTAIECVPADATTDEIDAAVDFAEAVLFDIWRI